MARLRNRVLHGDTVAARLASLKRVWSKPLVSRLGGRRVPWGSFETRGLDPTSEWIVGTLEEMPLCNGSVLRPV